MNTKQKTNWWIDASLFIIFMLAFFLNLTGLTLHQWIGLAGGLLAGYHWVAHWSWVKAVSQRFFRKTSNQARLYYLIDGTILVGFVGIIITGLVISTWLNLSLANYATWRTVHISASILTLLAVTLKIALHWRWIVATMKNTLAWKPVIPGLTSGLQPAIIRPRVGVKSMNRRDFLKVAGVVGLASFLALNESFRGLQAEVDSTRPSVDPEQGDSASLASPSVCTIRCNEGCSFPGRCRRYQDTNGNARCDLGECL